MIKAHTEYNNTVRKFNFGRDRQKRLKLINAKLKNAKEYWKLLKNSVAQTKARNVSIVNFESYFKQSTTLKFFFQPGEEILYFNERYLNSEIQIMFD